MGEKEVMKPRAPDHLDTGHLELMSSVVGSHVLSEFEKQALSGVAKTWET